ncbi:hypothetical protein [Anaeromyxobacter sp. PSR-1]|uniref:hypothetical protein n=1 Tax=Anaeromyxobacter sp. PSR-1 TaxID=1300915 RepID=UPI0005E6ACEB|nr:hypothetical protein [Anaeromyxobacter sp. PSR-1]GAO01160.1 hypothetical protein PSR1_00012 [Anaeromyxobacter sp. PSR-1]
MTGSRSRGKRRVACLTCPASLLRAAAPALLCAAAALPPPAAAQWDGATARWEEIHPPLADAPVEACVACHEEALMPNGNHPVGRVYAPGAASSLRPRAEVERRGVALPDGRVHCWSCHALRSRWRYHLAIPEGAATRPRVVPGDPSPYEHASGAPLPPGADVSPKPLCQACHTYGD